MKSRKIGNLIFLSLAVALKGLQASVLLNPDDHISQQGKIGLGQMEVKVDERPIYLYKVLSMDDWIKSSQTIHLSSSDADFIHLSTEDQLDKIIEKYWSDVPEYVVLKIETDKLSGKLILEANPGGTNKYYHLYNGSIPLNAITEALALKNF